MDIQDVIVKIKQNLTPDLLKKPYREINKNNPMYGHCYVATETLYHLMKNEVTLMPYWGKDEEGITHWWLVSSTGMIFDPTSEQYTSIGKVPPYRVGRKGAFLTKEPSKRSKVLMERINGKSS